LVGAALNQLLEAHNRAPVFSREARG
jgi:hypothetical protein